ncbi:glycoside hydrolase family 75 protein [Aspergillus clavatus NRRL 1]|uniref:Endo-chitosanase n=1 Tax=Aspergillus clavatus (strain ATCC 1007 / CBS 513.65 / DSM 816 / NCTC 3887 / NRRL 1 / QM 1276 / 107) TaxID=344612 RepID=A1CBX0_ASPCL|nr:fungal chitosanase, putative [Aspergillus clavatus NRRL 1]EAW13238.1 fungal chitosanase, putative [Aspergillus clavatus NRRL 1]
MIFKSSLSHAAASLLLLTPALAQKVQGPEYNKPSAGPPASFFAAAPTMPVAALKSAVARASVVPKNAAYPVNQDGGPTATIHADWASLPTAAAYVYTADMDVDCDGLDHNCKGNPDGQPDTNFGALAAYEVPFVVIPDRFATTYASALPGNNIVAVICDGKMFYGIFGDTDGDHPQVIGEASWLMARTCFPNDNLNGDSGHVPADVTYIFFTGKDSVLPSSAVNKNYITDFTKLRSMGDSLVNAFASQLGISSGGGNGGGDGGHTTLHTTTATRTATAPTSTATCDWEGHCLGTACSNNGECSDPFGCINGFCNYDPTLTCQWAGHCVGASCSSNDQCSDPFACIDGACAVDTSLDCSRKGHCAGTTCLSDSDCSRPLSCILGVCANQSG